MINLSGKAKGDGIHWPLNDGCSEYDLTVRLVITLYRLIAMFSMDSSHCIIEFYCSVLTPSPVRWSPLQFNEEVDKTTLLGYVLLYTKFTSPPPSSQCRFSLMFSSLVLGYCS